MSRILEWKNWPVGLVAAILAAFLVHLFTWFPDQVEVLYGGYFYPQWSRLLRFLTGNIPISLGDLFYVFLMIWIGIRLFRIRKSTLGGIFKSSVMVCCWIYIFFQLSWGLNYSRHTIEHRLQIPEEPADSSLLPGLTRALLQRTNEYAPARDTTRTHHEDLLEKAAVQGYGRVAEGRHLGQLSHLSVKRSLFGAIGNYLGYSGYFNPVTGEAQLNHTIPDVLHPFVMAHEMGHQLGYAREQEANLMGFLAARASDDSLLRYAAYFEMFLYANTALFRRDSVLALRHLEQLSPQGKTDLESLRRFRLQYRSKIEVVINVLYDRYLKLNGQSAGTASYGRVIRNLLAIYRKDGGV